MPRPVLIASITFSALVTVALGFFVIGRGIVRGTETCIRCAAQREVTRYGPLRSSSELPNRPECAWAETHIGRCADHAWEATGCWNSWRRVSCHPSPDGHSLMAALARLDDEPAVEFARRFAALPLEREFELWRTANLRWLPGDLGGEEREIAWSLATEAGWKDLASGWPR